jgi:hypothetical protein
MDPTASYDDGTGLINASLAQVVFPFEDWEFAAIATQAGVSVVHWYFVSEFWGSVGRNSTKLVHITVALFCLFAAVDPISALAATLQLRVPRFGSHYISQLNYGLVLLSSYLLLYAKQDELFRSGCGEIVRRKRRTQRRILLTLFTIGFVLYWLFGLMALNEGIRLIVVRETDTTQYLRVE